jgi:hypothetical protein
LKALKIVVAVLCGMMVSVGVRITVAYAQTGCDQHALVGLTESGQLLNINFINSQTAELTSRGEINFFDCTRSYSGLDYHPQEGTLYATCRDSENFRVVSVDGTKGGTMTQDQLGGGGA